MDAAALAALEYPAIVERLGLDPLLVADARARIAPERLQIGELLAEAEAAARARSRSCAIGAAGAPRRDPGGGTP